LGRDALELVVAGQLKLIGGMVAQAKQDPATGELTDEGEATIRFGSLVLQRLDHRDRSWTGGMGFGRMVSANLEYDDAEGWTYPVIGQTKNALDVEVERDVNRWTVVGKSRHVHVNEGIYLPSAWKETWAALKNPSAAVREGLGEIEATWGALLGTLPKFMTTGLPEQLVPDVLWSAVEDGELEDRRAMVALLFGVVVEQGDGPDEREVEIERPILLSPEERAGLDEDSVGQTIQALQSGGEEAVLKGPLEDRLKAAGGVAAKILDWVQEKAEDYPRLAQYGLQSLAVLYQVPFLNDPNGAFGTHPQSRINIRSFRFGLSHH
jgi:hypothetical protein